MYFTTFNHDDELDKLDELDENTNDLCLICWDPSTTNNKLIKMNPVISYLLFYKHCSCNGIFHYNCLLKWIDTTNSCPICRKSIERDINEENVVDLNYKSQIFRFIHFTNNNVYKIFKYIFLFTILKTIYDIVFDIQQNIEYNADLDEGKCL
jgi:hypothetical protein